MRTLLPRVAIIGRPNVGKSTLFNILTDSRKAVVKNQPGVTRDILMEPAEIWGRPFELIDTGGLTEATDTFSVMIKEAVSEFLSGVDLLIVVMDGRAGMLPEDRDVVRIAKTVGKDFCIVVNKLDKSGDQEMALSDFYEFGEDLIPTSFERRQGFAKLLEWLHERLKTATTEDIDETRISIVGKPNVGKSSLVNALVGEKRMLVSPIAGTTVDAVDTPFRFRDSNFRLIDTAGLRRSSKREEDVEIISAFKSQESIRRSDIVLLVIDGTQGPTDQDAKILSAILDSHKGVILVANKSDLGKSQVENYRTWLRTRVEEEFHFFPDIPLVFISALNETGLKDLLDTVAHVAEKLTSRISTGELNEFFTQTIRKAVAPVWGTTNVKFYYLTQTFQVPPAFIAFANHPDGVTPSYRRFLIKNLKDRFDLRGIPIRIFVMKSRKSGGGSDDA